MNIRTKGQGGERELGVLLSQLGGIECKRALGQARDGGADILDVPGLCIEVKRQETLVVNTWWRQVCRAADNRGEVPVLAYRQNRKAWKFCIPAYLLVVGIQGYITLEKDVFASWFKHWLSR